jgi:hypothetical protein
VLISVQMPTPRAFWSTSASRAVNFRMRRNTGVRPGWLDGARRRRRLGQPTHNVGMTTNAAPALRHRCDFAQVEHCEGVNSRMLQ